MQIKIKSTK